MNECEHIEIELSAIADGAGEPAAWVEVLDHLAVCASCRDFYRQVRTLDALAGAASRPVALEAPAGVWERVEASSGLAAVLPFTRRPAVRWALRVAATVLVALGLWAAGMLRLPSVLTVRDGMEVTMGADSGHMTDARFVELAVSVLKADRKYREKMLEILAAVDTAPPAGEDRRGALRQAVATTDRLDDQTGRDIERSPAQYY
jgi:predicted anti-sigma-YlaC factor YlaD